MQNLLNEQQFPGVLNNPGCLSSQHDNRLYLNLATVEHLNSVASNIAPFYNNIVFIISHDIL